MPRKILLGAIFVAKFKRARLVDPASLQRGRLDGREMVHTEKIRAGVSELKPQATILKTCHAPNGQAQKAGGNVLMGCVKAQFKFQFEFKTLFAAPFLCRMASGPVRWYRTSLQRLAVEMTIVYTL